MASQIDPNVPQAGTSLNSAGQPLRDNFRRSRDEINMLTYGTGTALAGTGLAVAQFGSGVGAVSMAEATTPYRRILRLRPAVHLPATMEGGYTSTPIEPVYIRFRLYHSHYMGYMTRSYRRIVQETVIAQNMQVQERNPGGETWSVLSTNSVGFLFVRGGSDEYFLDIDARGGGPTRIQVIETNAVWNLENQQPIDPDNPGGDVLIRSPRSEPVYYDDPVRPRSDQDVYQVSGLTDLAGTRYAKVTDGLRLGQTFRLTDANARKALCTYLHQFTLDTSRPMFDEVCFLRVKNTGGSNITFPGGSAVNLHHVYFVYGTTTYVPNPFEMRPRSFVDFFPKMVTGGQQWHPSTVPGSGWDTGGWIASDNSCSLLLWQVNDGTDPNYLPEYYVCNIAILAGNNIVFGTGTGFSFPIGQRPGLTVPAWFRQHIWESGGSSFEPNENNGPLSWDLQVEVWLKG